MKKIYLVFTVLIFTISCSKKSKTEILKTEIESQIKTKMNDPSSYEFDYFFIDSTSYVVRKQLISENLKKIDSLKKIKTEKAEDKIIDLEAQIYMYKKIDPYKFKGSIKFRGNNGFGAKVLEEYNFQADSLYKLIYLFDNVNDTVYKDIEVMNKEFEELTGKSVESKPNR